MKQQQLERNSDPFRGLTGLQLPQHYYLLNRVSNGLSGGVFEAAHNRAGVSKLVFVRMIPRCGEEQGDLFDAAMQLARGLTHPNLVGVIDHGQTDSYLYVVMERVPGQSLQQLLAQSGPMDPRDAARIGIEALGGLGYAHRSGTVHGCIRPSDMLVTHLDSPNVDVKLAGLGLGETLAYAESTGEMPVSSEETPLSQAPELHLGHKPTEASDIFALAATLYRAIAGRPPYRNRLVEGELHDTPTSPPPLLSPRGAFVSTDLDATIRTALAIRPEQRIGSAAEFGRRLRRCLVDLEKGRKRAPVQPSLLWSSQQTDAHLVTWIPPRLTPPRGLPTVGGPGGQPSGDARRTATHRNWRARRLVLGLGVLVAVALALLALSTEREALGQLRALFAELGLAVRYGSSSSARPIRQDTVPALRSAARTAATSHSSASRQPSDGALVLPEATTSLMPTLPSIQAEITDHPKTTASGLLAPYDGRATEPPDARPPRRSRRAKRRLGGRQARSASPAASRPGRAVRHRMKPSKGTPKAARAKRANWLEGLPQMEDNPYVR